MCKVLAAVALTLASFLVLPPVEGQGRMAKLLRPLNLTVNTAADEDDPFVADKDQTLYWTVTKNGKDDIWVVKRSMAAAASGGAWPARLSKIVEDYVTSKGDDRSVYATTGRYPRFMYFASKKDPKGKNFDLYIAVSQDLGKAWSSPTPVMNVNTEDDELHPWLTADGKSLYFSRKTKTGWRVYVTTRETGEGAGGWGTPQSIGLPKDFCHATLMPKGDIMYVQGRVDDDRWGLFVSRKAGTEWTKPTPLDTLNHLKGPKGDLSPSLSRDGKILYFASDRPGGKGGLDLYSIATAEVAKKK